MKKVIFFELLYNKFLQLKLDKNLTEDIIIQKAVLCSIFIFSSNNRI